MHIPQEKYSASLFPMSSLCAAFRVSAHPKCCNECNCLTPSPETTPYQRELASEFCQLYCQLNICDTNHLLSSCTVRVKRSQGECKVTSALPLCPLLLRTSMRALSSSPPLHNLMVLRRMAWQSSTGYPSCDAQASSFASTSGS